MMNGNQNTQDLFTEDKTLSIERAREILGGGCKLSDEEISEVLNTINIFCQITYANYLNSQNQNPEGESYLLMAA